MSTFKLLLALAASPALLLAQLNNNTVTATASQSTSTPPDQALISITVLGGSSATLEQIVATLSGVGVTAANLNYVFGLGPSNRQWTFQLPVAIAEVETTTTALTSLQKSISQNNSGLTLSFNVSGTRVSTPSSANCDFSKLLSEARTQAQQIAGAAGLQTGAITGLNATTAACSLTATFAIPTLLAQLGPNTITISASGSAPQNDQASIYFRVNSPLTAEPSDISSALTAAGLPGANLTGLTTQTIYNQNGTAAENQLVWSFTLTVPLAKLTATLAEVASAAQVISKQGSGLQLFFNEAQASASPTQQASACSQSTLVRSALALAQQITSVAGVSVGPVSNMWQGGSGVAGAIIFNPSNAYIAAPLSLPCSLTVQYQLLL